MTLAVSSRLERTTLGGVKGERKTFEREKAYIRIIKNYCRLFVSL